MSYGCIVFDVDDTLYLERDYVRSGFEAVGQMVAAQYGFTEFAERAWHKFETGVRGNTFNQVLAEAGVELPPEKLQQLVDCYRTHYPRIRLCEDAANCTKSLHGRVLLAGITDGPVASQRAKIEALGLNRWLAPIIVTGELGPGRSKPNPEAYRYVEQATHLPGPRHVYVGDNPAKDFAAPHAMGWTTVRLKRPLGLHESSPSGPDVSLELASLDQLAPLLAL